MKDKPKSRKVIIDWRAFDPLQIRILEEVAREIHGALKEAGIPAGKKRELTENLTFGIAAIIDGSRMMELDGYPVVPVLTFEKRGADLIGAEGSSWMHEYAIGTVEELLDPPRKAGPRIWMIRMEFEQSGEGGIGAYSVGVDMSKAVGAILKELATDSKRFKKAKLPVDKIAKAFLIGPSGKKKKFEVKPLIASGFKAVDIYKAFKDADKSG
jgi:hypothetical protein